MHVNVENSCKTINAPFERSCDVEKGNKNNSKTKNVKMVCEIEVE